MSPAQRMHRARQTVPRVRRRSSSWSSRCHSGSSGWPPSSPRSARVASAMSPAAHPGLTSSKSNTATASSVNRMLSSSKSPCMVTRRCEAGSSGSSASWSQASRSGSSAGSVSPVSGAMSAASVAGAFAWKRARAVRVLCGERVGVERFAWSLLDERGGHRAECGGDRRDSAARAAGQGAGDHETLDVGGHRGEPGMTKTWVALDRHHRAVPGAMPHGVPTSSAIASIRAADAPA
jgi:hypothetical protein